MSIIVIVSIAVTIAYLASLGLSLALDGTIHVQPLWLAVTAIFMAERVVTVRSRGLLQMALAGVLVVEMAFDFFLQGVHLKALWDAALDNERSW